MSSKRAPSAPPQIDGYEFKRVIGSGGFADVFLYEQQRPRRQVAIKVLLKEWSSATQRETFDAEADLMATLGNHPSIVTMYEAATAGDGRPYLAMEFCSRPNLGARYRSERFSVAEALRTTIQIAGAVETAHRLGILHRDIKPANILVTQFGHPALTDFGIASTVDQASAAEGMSIPWSPPESFQDPPVSGIATDVWGLAATCYTLLAGRTPFEVPGGSNRSADLMARIETAALPALGRSDVPPSLERVLATAMSKRPASRYPTALAFARALQQVQVEMSRDMTPIDILDESGQMHQEEDDEQDGTRFRNIVSIDPGQQAPPAAPPAAGPGTSPGFVPTASPAGGFGPPATTGAGAPPYAGAPSSSMSHTSAPDLPFVAGDRSGVGTVEETVARTSLPASQRGAQEYVAPTPQEEEPKPSPWRLVAPILGVVALVGIGILVFLLRPWDAPADEGDDPTVAETVGGDFGDDIVPNYLAPPLQLEAEPDGDQVIVTWERPNSFEEGDQFGYRVRRLSDETTIYEPLGNETTVTVPREAGDTCVEVVTMRDNNVSDPAEACVAAEGAGG
ncbi:serine/threonine-protein kinase [Myceligenerans pegani]|uniref:non-specific serine/threonine protein kinase n=1 Tax=Myceligenerans pegani TaxID=2776917 RepID=A0ABR9N6H5_9MICO|nr:serine/threonine-protein kinase [Myceligenerans sp. TRM 65318]MBE1878876.1 serine/threonine protein kinase [Myceligenerans sp. TRM 65318]MBE3021147.1 serine/threonine protein kinase [Myceligenerans sp. TRM 65318]